MKSRNKERTRKDILRAAEELFATKGFSDTSMRDLAAHAEIKAPTLYHYFSSKTDLLIELFRDFYHELGELYDNFEKDLPADVPLRHALESFQQVHQTFIKERPRFSAIFLFEGMREGSVLRHQLSDVTEPSAQVLRQLALRWPHHPPSKVVALFLAVVGMNLFYQQTHGYLEIVAGESLPDAQRQEALRELIGNHQL